MVIVWMKAVVAQWKSVGLRSRRLRVQVPSTAISIFRLFFADLWPTRAQTASVVVWISFFCHQGCVCVLMAALLLFPLVVGSSGFMNYCCLFGSLFEWSVYVMERNLVRFMLIDLAILILSTSLDSSHAIAPVKPTMASSWQWDIDYYEPEQQYRFTNMQDIHEW